MAGRQMSQTQHFSFSTWKIFRKNATVHCEDNQSNVCKSDFKYALLKWVKHN